MKSPMPHWPAAMKREMAAQYCHLSVAEFEREIVDGRLPNPIMLGRHEHWVRRKLDEALERMSGGQEDWRVKLGLSNAA